MKRITLFLGGHLNVLINYVIIYLSILMKGRKIWVFSIILKNMSAIYLMTSQRDMLIIMKRIMKRLFFGLKKLLIRIMLMHVNGVDIVMKMDMVLKRIIPKQSLTTIKPSI